MSSKKLNNQELNDVSGGKGNLDKYLKTLERTDKNKVLVDYGKATALDPNSTFEYDDSGNLIIISREKNKTENVFPTLDTRNDNEGEL